MGPRRFAFGLLLWSSCAEPPPGLSPGGCELLDCPGQCLDDGQRARCLCPPDQVSTDEGCRACPLATDGQVVLDVEAPVRFSGRITIDGEPPTVEAERAVWVSLAQLRAEEDEAGPISESLAIPGGGDSFSSWEAWVPPGRYAVMLSSSARSVAAGLPNNVYVEVGRFDVLSDRDIEVDVRTSLVRVLRRVPGDDETVPTWARFHPEGQRSQAAVTTDGNVIRLVQGRYETEGGRVVEFRKPEETVILDALPPRRTVRVTVRVDGQLASSSGPLAWVYAESPRGRDLDLSENPSELELPLGEVRWFASVVLDERTQVLTELSPIEVPPGDGVFEIDLDVRMHRLRAQLSFDGPTAGLGDQLVLSGTDGSSGGSRIPLDEGLSFDAELPEGSYRFFYRFPDASETELPRLADLHPLGPSFRLEDDSVRNLRLERIQTSVVLQSGGSRFEGRLKELRLLTPDGAGLGPLIDGLDPLFLVPGDYLLRAQADGALGFTFAAVQTSRTVVNLDTRPVRFFVSDPADPSPRPLPTGLELALIQVGDASEAVFGPLEATDGEVKLHPGTYRTRLSAQREGPIPSGFPPRGEVRGCFRIE